MTKQENIIITFVMQEINLKYFQLKTLGIKINDKRNIYT